MVNCGSFWPYFLFFGRSTGNKHVSEVFGILNVYIIDIYDVLYTINIFLRNSGFHDYNMLRLKTNLSPTNCDGFMSIVGQERFKIIVSVNSWTVKSRQDFFLDNKVKFCCMGCSFCCKNCSRIACTGTCCWWF